MLAYQNDTITALATPPGRGGIAIVRVSGENARAYFDLCWAITSGLSQIRIE